MTNHTKYTPVVKQRMSRPPKRTSNGGKQATPSRATSPPTPRVGPTRRSQGAFCRCSTVRLGHAATFYVQMQSPRVLGVRQNRRSVVAAGVLTRRVRRCGRLSSRRAKRIAARARDWRLRHQRMPAHFMRRTDYVLAARLDDPRTDRQAGREVLVVAHPVAPFGDVADRPETWAVQVRRHVLVQCPLVALERRHVVDVLGHDRRRRAARVARPPSPCAPSRRSVPAAPAMDGACREHHWRALHGRPRLRRLQ